MSQGPSVQSEIAESKCADTVKVLVSHGGPSGGLGANSTLHRASRYVRLVVLLPSPSAATRPADHASLDVRSYVGRAACHRCSACPGYRSQLQKAPGGPIRIERICTTTGSLPAQDHYNYVRDYDASIGRYSQSDPMGLVAGLNTHMYVASNPLANDDPYGLDAFSCYKPLHALGPFGRLVFRPTQNQLHHQYLCVIIDGKKVCGGQDRKGGPWSEGKPSDD
jgi:RHS repeat-associated protein